MSSDTGTPDPRVSVRRTGAKGVAVEVSVVVVKTVGAGRDSDVPSGPERVWDSSLGPHVSDYRAATGGLGRSGDP